MYVWGDEFKIEEVLMNYFSNAVNHCSGQKIIDIKLKLSKNKQIYETNFTVDIINFGSVN